MQSFRQITGRLFNLARPIQCQIVYTNHGLQKLSTFPDLSKIKEKIVSSKNSDQQALTHKQRIVKKKPKKGVVKSYFDSYKVKSYATADYYNLKSLKKGLIDSGAYSIVDFQTDMPSNCLVARPKYPELNEREPRHMFFFEEGTTVFWNVSPEEQNSLLEMLLKHSELFYTQELINEESEYLTYSTLAEELETSKNTQNVTRLEKNHVFFRKHNPEDIFDEEEYLLEKYAFSDAISISVQLGIWETKLDQFSEKIEYISIDLKQGKKLQLELDEVLQKLGELFTMRHMVNLDSNFLETPDFYWDREHLESLYLKLYYHLSVSKRTKLFNDKLNHCIDLMQILNQHLNEKKHTRLEWIIIILIAIEAAAALGLIKLAKDVVSSVADYIIESRNE